MTDLTMLTLGSGLATLAAPGGATGLHLLLAGLFSIVAVAVLHSARGAEHRLHPSILDASMQALGAVSAAAVLTMAAASVVGGTHSIQLTSRLWLFAAVSIPVARVVLSAFADRPFTTRRWPRQR